MENSSSSEDDVPATKKAAAIKAQPAGDFKKKVESPDEPDSDDETSDSDSDSDIRLVRFSNQ